jgi:hypothetical protein
MKPIKFDLPLNGTRIATLEQLEENLTPEILEPFRSASSPHGACGMRGFRNDAIVPRVPLRSTRATL